MFRLLCACLVLASAAIARADDWPTVSAVEAQPLLAQVKRLSQALDSQGQPLPENIRKAIADLQAKDGDAAAVVQKMLDPLCIAAVEIGERGAERALAASHKTELIEQGWRIGLVKVVNKPGATGRLRIDSPSARPVPNAPSAEVAQRWLGLSPYTAQPLLPNLSGLGLEYTAIQIFSRDAGEKTAELVFSIEGGGGLKFDNAKKPEPTVAKTIITFDARAAILVTFQVTEADGSATTAGFIIRDKQGRVYPAQPKRLAPDFFFHPQVYRATGETVHLPAGTYTVLCRRGPESLPEEKQLVVADKPVTFAYKVARWVDPSTRGWYSGDHHIHAAGCAHYENPTQGVDPIDMMRHILGEDLKVGCCLTWGPCFDHQKLFFTGRPDDVSRYPYLLRYDVEVSGFGSHASGHLNLLKLTEQIPPGGDSKNHWPTLGMNTLRWAKKQGAVCGPAHSGNGLTRFVGRVEGAQDGPAGLPHFNIPAYDGIGANEFIVDVTHEVPGPDGRPVPAVDFISAMDTNRIAEWTMWYHVLNCGFRTRVSGETDFPCISGDRVGMGRVYVKVDDKLDFAGWVRGIADGRSYVSDGQTHLMDLTAKIAGKTYELGVKSSEIRLEKAGKIELTVHAAAWHATHKTVPVELVVNGLPVEKQELACDGKGRELRFQTELSTSSWVAVRVMPSAHTNPFFVLVDGKPIRASKASAQWCLQGVEQCWKSKQNTYHKDEQAQAEADYEHARQAYIRIARESAGVSASQRELRRLAVGPS